jgi:hypothetical protein
MLTGDDSERARVTATAKRLRCTAMHHLHARAAADRRRSQAAARPAAAASERASGPGYPGEGTWRRLVWWEGAWVGAKAWLTGVENACKSPPYNVVLSRRHEPVEHSSTCARSLRRSRERGVVVREILWGGRGVTNTGGPQGRLQVRRGQCKRRQGSHAEQALAGRGAEAEEGEMQCVQCRRRAGGR